MALLLSLTLDDAPMLGAVESRIPDAVADWDAMDRIREGLERLRVPHCVAFVIGSTAERHPAPLERWLAAGYELGNHTHDHVPARERDVASFKESVERCDAVLERLGAFRRGRPKWFRFPLLDYGASAKSRGELRAVLGAMSYRIAHASTDLYDHAFEGPLGAAARRGDPLLGAVIRGRFRRNAAFSVWQSQRLVKRHFGPGVPLVLFSHFGRVSHDGLVPVLEGLESGGVTWCSLEAALEHEPYRRMDSDNALTGLVTGALERSLAWRATRKATELARPTVDRWLGSVGPLLPALYNG